MKIPQTKYIFAAISSMALLCSSASLAATFSGSSRASTGDSTSAFSGGASNALTVSCWFKMSIPSGVILSKDMVVLSNRQISTAGGNFAFEIAFSIASGNVEFRAQGANGALPAQTLIALPFLERWYHVAVTRAGDNFIGYLDGREVFNANQAVGASTNASGITVGGTGDSANLFGEVQEVAVYRRKLTPSNIRSRMFVDQPTTDTDLRGYYKLRFSTTIADQLKNFATPPPASTDPLVISGPVTFEVANQAGEQSTFDSHRNGGRDATAPLGGSFSWDHTVFRRGTVGIPFEFKIGYNSGNSAGGFNIPGFSISETNGLGAGWSHTFDARVIPSNIFEPLGTLATIGLMLWDGSLEVWDAGADELFRPRHGEYRGEIAFVGSPFAASAVLEWTTPDRLKYRFYNPFAGTEELKGRLKEIRDFSNNVIALTWLADGRLDKATDTAGGVCQFNYAGSQLSSVTYLGWTATFTANAAASNRLATLALSGPAAYSAVQATWGLYYKTSVASTDPTFALLEKVADPRGYNGGSPTYYDVQITYDKYGRVTQQLDGFGRSTLTGYGVDQTGTAAPRKVTRTDAAEKKWVETFDRKLRVTARRSSLNFTTAFEINDATGTVAATTDANGNRTEFTYDGRANVRTRKVVPLNQTTTWEYNAMLTGGVPLNRPTKESRPATAEAPAGWETNYSYDTAGNLLTQSDAIGSLVSNTYTARGELLTSTDARTNAVSFTYSLEGFLASKTVPDIGGTTRTWNFTYTELGWLSTEINPLAQTAYLFQDINGHVITVVDPIGRVFNKVFDANGNLTQDYDANGQLTQHTYDFADQRSTTQQRDHTAATQRIWTYGYTLRGESLLIRDPSLNAPTNTASYEYDDDGRRTKETDANGFFTTFAYDSNGNLRFTTDKENKIWEKQYDALNRVITDKDPLGDTTTTTYDAAGRVDKVTSPRGFATSHEYDGRSRLHRWIDATGSAWIYTYDGNGNITDIEDALHGHYYMAYGPRNERLSEENQDHFVWSYTYDELLRLKTQTDPAPGGITRTLNYDDASRIEEVVFSTGRRTVFFHDWNNNPQEIRRVVPGQPTTTLHLTYDVMDRLTQSSDAFAKTVGYTFDPAGRVKTMVYPGSKTLTHFYDPAGRFTKLTDWAARDSLFAYDKVGRLKQHTYPNQVIEDLTFNDDGTVKTLGYTKAATTLIALEYAYDHNGNKTSEKKKGALDWTPGTGLALPFDETYTPTAAGRLVNSTDALTPARNFTYTYNASGDMTTAASPGATYGLTYDEDHRTLTVARIAGAATTAIANRYDALGRRIARTLTAPGGTPVETRYVLGLTGGMERILADTDATGTVLARYIHGPDGLGYREDASGTLTCYHADAQGNIVRLTDATGAALADYAYSDYGRLLATTGTAANPYRFVGSQGVMEELPNLYFMRARYYSAEAGVFLSTDPVKNIGSGWKPEAYGYASGNPSLFSDPTGMMSAEGLARYQSAIADSLAYQQEAIYLQAEVEILEATSDALDTTLSLFTGDWFGVGTGLAKQGAGLASALGYEKTGTGIGFAADTADIVHGIYDVTNYKKTVRSVGYVKAQVTQRGLSGVANLSASSKTAGRVAELAGTAVKAGITAVDAYSYNKTTSANQSKQLASGTNAAASISAPAGSGLKGSSSGGSGSGGSGTYTVKAGDTLGNIASRNGTTATALGTANGIKNLNVIRPGQKITIPKRK